MKKFSVKGMSCAACAARVEKAVSSLEKVDICSVNLLANSMQVEGLATVEEIIAAVKKAGYFAELESGTKKTFAPSLKKVYSRLIFSAILLIILMYFSMGYNMLSLPLPLFLSGNPLFIALIQMVLALSIMIINRKFFINGIKGIINRSPNMDILVSLGSLASFIYSLAGLFKIISYTASYEITKAQHILHDLYFEAAAMILVIITLGKLLEEYSKGKTTNAVAALIDLVPEKATVIVDGKEIVKDIKDIAIGDYFIVKPGERIPVDAIITDGFTSMDESALTGESASVEKHAGDKVFTATINLTGFIKCRAEKIGEDTSFAKIIKLVNDASSSKAKAGRIADKVSGIFVPIVLTISLITFILWLILDSPISFALSRAVSVLVISCPCALGLATPVAIMVGNGKGAKNGILYKSAEALEKAAKIKIVCLDKTGTLTLGTPEVTDVYPIDTSLEVLLSVAYSLEKQSQHPLAKAIIEYAEKSGVPSLPTTNFNYIAGGGITANIEEKTYYAGNYRFVKDKTIINEETISLLNTLRENGKTVIFFIENDSLIGLIALSDTVRADAKETIDELKKMHITPIMLTGDNEGSAKRIAALVGIDKVYAELLPEDKISIIKELQNEGFVAMVGDGINDAPALTGADIGVALSDGSDIAIESGDIIITRKELSTVNAAIKLSRKTLNVIHYNLFWAFFYNVLCIPLAAGVFVNTLNITISPMLAAAAMSLSDICVVTNALRLNFIKLFKPKEENMEKVIIIEGMMCPHCENRVKTLLEELPEVIKANVSHTEGTAKITLSADIKNEALASLITNAGYTVKEIN